MKKALTYLILAALVLLLAYPVGIAVDKAFGRDLIRIEGASDADTIALNRELFDDEGLSPEERKAAVVEIYGSNPKGAVRERYLFVDDERVIVPAEDETLVLLPRTEDYYPKQSESLLFIAKQISFASMIGLAVLLLTRRLACGG